MSLFFQKKTMSLLLFIFLFTINQITAAKSVDAWSLYETWIAKHGKSYNGAAEKEQRFKIFKDNLKYIENHNSKSNSGYQMGLNQFSDLNNDEFQEISSCIIEPAMSSRHTRRRFDNDSDIIIYLPASVDWRSKGVIGSIKAQGRCGSCWAFSTIASVEALHAQYKNELIDLSEQELIDCDKNERACKGGFPATALSFIIDNGGINTEREYPYTGSVGECNESKKNVKAVSILGYSHVHPNNERTLQVAVASHPAVSVVVDAGGAPFKNYKGGIFKGPCGTNLSHAINIVGYGMEDGEDYWILRNSWGPLWGEQGYMRIQRNIANDTGLCGIAMYPVYPIYPAY